MWDVRLLNRCNEYRIKILVKHVDRVESQVIPIMPDGHEVDIANLMVGPLISRIMIEFPKLYKLIDL